MVFTEFKNIKTSVCSTLPRPNALALVCSENEHNAVERSDKYDCKSNRVCQTS